MASYNLVLKQSVAKDLRSLPKADVATILARIQSLAGAPRPVGCEGLAGQERYRVRHGVYRFLYAIRDRELVITVAKTIYHPL